MEKFIQRLIAVILSPREDVKAVHAELKEMRAELAAFISPAPSVTGAAPVVEAAKVTEIATATAGTTAMESLQAINIQSH